MIPILHTERLVLRGPRRDDFPAYAAFWASPRSAHEGGPRDERGAWDDFAGAVGLWAIEGIGNWCLEERGTGAFAGMVGLNHPVHFPEVEIGWTLLEPFEGRGLAQEAARAILGWTWASTDLPSLVVYIEPENARSIRTAEALGARPDPDAAPVDPGDLVLRIHRPEGAA